MSTAEANSNREPEFGALVTVYDALKGLDVAAQERVIDYVIQKLGLTPRGTTKGPSHLPEALTDTPSTLIQTLSQTASHHEEDGLEGISPLAKKWMTRNGLDSQSLSALFSLGTDEIDLVARTVPGKSKRERMRSVLLLKAVAAYLSSGVARVTHEQVKEACLHYDAYDPPNHAKYLKVMAAEASGTKDAGYALTARGMTAATEMIKVMHDTEKDN